MTVTALNANTNDVSSSTLQEWLSFSLDCTHYAIDILRVIEIRVWEPVTQIPYAPRHVLGLINLRGAIVPIIDLKQRMGLCAERQGKGCSVVLIVSVRIGQNEKIMGVAVDAISDVLQVSPQQQSLPDFEIAIEHEFVRGIAEHQDQMVVQLDIDQVLAISEEDNQETV